jgi:transposase
MREILRLRTDLEAAAVTVVVMEATGHYWKPFFYVLADTLPVELVNARAARNIPGRKTDVSDAAWLAQLAANGLLRACFVPEEPIRQLRDLTRTRATLTGERTREFHRIEGVLEDACLKLGVVVSSLTGLTARRILDLLAAGESDPVVLADAACGSLRKKTPELVEALTGRVNGHHAFLLGLHLGRIDGIEAAMAALDGRIEQVIAPFSAARDALSTIPGVSTTVANAIIAEIGADMSQFPTAAHLASWAGVSPGQNESAGRSKSTHVQPGDRYLKAALGIAALSAARSKGTALAARYHRIIARRGKKRAVVALERTILTAVWNMLTNGELYRDPGAGYYALINPERTKNRAIRMLKTLGYDVTVNPRTAA